jgi:formyl-CoA transferase
MGCFRSADGYVNIAGPSGRLLWRFCATIGLPDLPNDPRFDTMGKRSANRAELNAIVAERIASRTTAEWVEALNATGVPCGPVNTIDQVFADPQVEHLGMVTPVTHPALGSIGIVRNAVTMTGSAPTVRTHSPDPGEHTDEILRGIGLSDDEIASLRARGAV